MKHPHRDAQTACALCPSQANRRVGTAEAELDKARAKHAAERETIERQAVERAFKEQVITWGRLPLWHRTPSCITSIMKFMVATQSTCISCVCSLLSTRFRQALTNTGTANALLSDRLIGSVDTASWCFALFPTVAGQGSSQFNELLLPRYSQASQGSYRCNGEGQRCC